MRSMSGTVAVARFSPVASKNSSHAALGDGATVVRSHLPEREGGGQGELARTVECAASCGREGAGVGERRGSPCLATVPRDLPPYRSEHADVGSV